MRFLKETIFFYLFPLWVYQHLFWYSSFSFFFLNHSFYIHPFLYSFTMNIFTKFNFSCILLPILLFPIFQNRTILNNLLAGMKIIKGLSVYNTILLYTHFAFLYPYWFNSATNIYFFSLKYLLFYFIFSLILSKSINFILYFQETNARCGLHFVFSTPLAPTKCKSITLIWYFKPFTLKFTG